MKALLLFLGLLSTPAWALFSGSSSSEDGPTVKYSVGAALGLEGVYYPATLPEGNQALGITNGEVSASLRIGQTWAFKLRPTGHWDPANRTERERAWGDVPEAYAQWKVSLGESGSLSLRAGMDTFTWGVTDAFNPVDVVSARRYSDPLRSEKLGALSLTARLETGIALIEGIYIPRQRKSTLPGENSRWLPREVGGEVLEGDALFLPPEHPTYSFRPDRELDSALKNNFGLRLSTHQLGLDLAGYYFNGAASVPAVKTYLTANATKINLGGNPQFIIQANRNIALEPIYHRVSVAGASVVAPIGEVIARAEIAFTNDQQKNFPAITERTTEAVAELEHTFSFEKASLTAALLGTWADVHENSLNASSTPSLTRMFDRGLGAGLRWQPMSEWQSTGFVLFDTKYGGQLVHLESNYSLSDAWSVYGLGEILAGKTTTPIGVYRKNDRVALGMRVKL